MLTLWFIAAFGPMAPSPEVPIPEGCQFVFESNGWIVLNPIRIVPGTESFRAQIFEHQYYAARVGSDKGRLVFEGQGTSGPRVLDIRIDGTVVLDIYPALLTFVGPGDPPAKIRDGKPVKLKGVSDDMQLLHANAEGIVVVPPTLNAKVKLYFIPLKDREPQGDRAIELCEREANSLYRTRTGFHLAERWVAWGGREIGLPYTKPLHGKVSVLDCRSGKRWDPPIPIDSAILGIRDDLLVVRYGKEPAGELAGQVDVFNLKTQKLLVTYPTESETRLLAIRDSVGYFIRTLPNEVGKLGGRYEIFLLDLIEKRESLFRKEVPPAAALSRVDSMPTGKGLLVTTSPPVTIPWKERPASK